MGNDGTRGAADIVAAGGSVIAQDEATSVVWGMPRSVAQAGLCSAVLPLNQIAPKILGLIIGRPVVTPLDYDFLRNCLKQRSGLVLSADKQYLVESRLLPVARKAGLVNLAALVDPLKRGDEALMTCGRRGDGDQRIVLLSRQGAVRSFPLDHHAGADFRAPQLAHHPHLVRRRLDRPGAVFAGNVL